jgi:predicted PurR-regulated permease PerM
MKLNLKLPPWFAKGLILPLIVLNGWLLLLIFEYFQSLISIFLAATLLSFLVDYPVRQLEKWRIKRSIAVLIVLLFVVLLLGILGVTLIPLVIEQLNGLLERLPSWLESGSQQIDSLETWASNRNFPLNISDELLGRISSQLRQISGQVVGGLISALSSILDLLLTVVLTFYLLLHGQELWQGLFKFFPQHLATKIPQILQKTFQNYFIGQATVAATMGLTMTIAFLIIQVPFGLLFGVGVGVMALFPFGGALSIVVISFLVSLKSVWLGLKVLVIAVIIEQLIENAIAPRLLGGFTGLNPVLILLSLLVGAKIAGLLGLVLAVPLTSFIKSIVTTMELTTVTTE